MSNADSEGASEAVVLDVLPHGRADDDRPRYQKSPLAFALGTAEFRLYEFTLADDADISIADRVSIDPPEEGIDRMSEVGYDDLSGGARSELEYVVSDLLDEEEARFVEFYNEAGPITLRLHQLDLLPGIGEKLRNGILDERKRTPFSSFEEIHERVSGLHDPREVIEERIVEEIREEEVKYRLFARRG